MIKRLIENHEMPLCFVLIGLYVVVNSFCVQQFGTADYRSALVNTAFSLILLWLVIGSERRIYYGLTGIKNVKAYLYFLPLIAITSVNLWNGIHLPYPLPETVFYILTMLNVGLIEELIFRGFLFRMMAKDNVKTATVVSAITFGIGHIINLINGADLIPTLLQICYATAVGFLFVILFRKSGSLVPCILVHSLTNASSVFYEETPLLRYVIPLFLIVVSLGYSYYLCKTVKTN